MLRLLIFIVILFDCTFVSSQKEDFQWIYNWTSIDDVTGKPDRGASILDFNFDPPKTYRNEQITLDFQQSNASICDENGQLLLYSNQQAIHGPDHRPIINGERINYSPDWERFAWENENDVLKPYGFRQSQGCGIVPIPNQEKEYFVFYLNFETALNDYKYALLRKDSGTGKFSVIQKDSTYLEQLDDAGNLTACQHANGRDWWVLHYSNDTVHNVLIDPTGFHVQEAKKLDVPLRGGIGQIKFSPEGDKLIYYKAFELWDAKGTDFALFDFDRCSGTLSNGIYKQLASHNNIIDNGVEWSPNGRYVYRSNLLYIYQYDTEADDFFRDYEIVGEFDGYTHPISNFPADFGLMQRGPDNKIYISEAAQGYFVNVIHHPDRKGLACDFEQRAITLPTYVQGTIPTLNTYRLGPLDESSCDTLGIDNHPVSRFRYEQDSLDVLEIYFVDLSYYEPDNWLWEFGDGESATDRFPTHTYEATGVYEVCLTVSNFDSENRSCQTLNLGTTSVNESIFNYDISLYPNPVEHIFRIGIHNYVPLSPRISLYHISGKKIIDYKFRGQQTSVDISSFQAGIYYYEVYDGKKKLKSGKIVKI